MQAALLVIAALSILVGGAQMLQQASLRRILAYSSVAQLGYALLGLALGTPLGLAAAAAHLMHHALVKPPLFMAAGLLAQRAHVQTLDEGGGLARKMPVTTLLFCLAGLSLSGLPLFSGFVSKTMLEEAALHEGAWWLAAVAILGSTFTFAGMARLAWRVFFAPATETHKTEQKEFPLLALLPIGALVVGSVVVGVWPQGPASYAAWPAALALADAPGYEAAVMGEATTPDTEIHFEEEPPPSPFDWHHWWAPAIILVGGGALAYAVNARQQREHATPDAVSRWVGGAASLLRRWHSGIVNDYALWGTVGTTILLAVLMLSAIFVK
jgi:formate hydrogenlyase subunit 3/multisubunit Na+/H+ antiporter MnhD subunit